MSGMIRRFEDFTAWQKARALAARIYASTKDGDFARDFALRDQVRRASVSIMSNTAEGFERGRASEFHQFLPVAKASCAEPRSQLYVALDAGYIRRDLFEGLMQEAEEVGRIAGGLRSSVQQRRTESCS